jgi:hypothetical protein
MRASLLGLGAAATVLVLPTAALAYDVLAVDCAQQPTHCKTGAVSFSVDEASPAEWMVDTGWVPQGSGLQVHLLAAVHANMQLGLSGALEASWPDALLLRAPGNPGGGSFGVHYGVEVVAEGKVQITVLGQSFSWTGDLPYVPQVDFQVEASGEFDAWGFDPGYSVTGTTLPQTVADIGLGAIIGGSIPGIDGGFQLDVALELTSTWIAERIVITTPDGVPVEGGAITAEDGTSNASYLGGPGVELDVHPEGRVEYQGTLHLVPTMFVEILGQKITMPVADIPAPLPPSSQPLTMAAHRVRFPLPDLDVAVERIDFGDVVIGDDALRTFAATNVGEALVAATLASSDSVFAVGDDALQLEAEEEAVVAVVFSPAAPGEVVATLEIASNDPDQPARILELVGNGVAADQEPVDEPDPAEPGPGFSPTAKGGGCGCHQAGSAPEGLGALLALAAAGALSRRRRAALTATRRAAHRGASPARRSAARRRC